MRTHNRLSQRSRTTIAAQYLEVGCLKHNLTDVRYWDVCPCESCRQEYKRCQQFNARARKRARGEIIRMRGRLAKLWRDYLGVETFDGRSAYHPKPARQPLQVGL